MHRGPGIVPESPDVRMPRFVGAACAGTPVESWYPDHDESLTKRQIRVCQSCPVRQACLAWALKYEAYGIWGGTTSHERHELRKRLRAA